MVHLYLDRRFDRSDWSKQYRILCERTWVNAKTGDEVNYTTRPKNVTCGACLEILLPKEEEIVRTMRENYARWKSATPTVITSSEDTATLPSCRSESSSSDSLSTGLEDSTDHKIPEE